MVTTKQVVDAMNAYLPEKTTGKYYQIAQKYLDLCVSEMLEGYGRSREA